MYSIYCMKCIQRLCHYNLFWKIIPSTDWIWYIDMVRQKGCCNSKDLDACCNSKDLDAYVRVVYTSGREITQVINISDIVSSRDDGFQEMKYYTNSITRSIQCSIVCCILVVQTFVHFPENWYHSVSVGPKLVQHTLYRGELMTNITGAKYHSLNIVEYSYLKCRVYNFGFQHRIMPW